MVQGGCGCPEQHWQRVAHQAGQQQAARLAAAATANRLSKMALVPFSVSGAAASQDLEERLMQVNTAEDSYGGAPVLVLSMHADFQVQHVFKQLLH